VRANAHHLPVGSSSVRTMGTGGHGVRRAVAAAVTAPLVVALCTGCPALDTYEVANATEESLLVDGHDIRPGATREFRIDGGCENVYAYAGNHERVAVRSLCADDHWAVGPDDLGPGKWATVVNATEVAVAVWFEGAEPVEGLAVPPGAEATVSLAAEDDACAGQVDGRAVLWAQVGGAGNEGSVVHHWGETCHGDRWVIDEQAVAAERGAVLTLVNDTGVELIHVGLSVGSRGGDDHLAVGESAEFVLGVPATECLEGTVRGRSPGEGSEMLLVDEDLELCDGTVTLTRGDLQHRVDGRWVPLDYDPAGWARP